MFGSAARKSGAYRSCVSVAGVATSRTSFAPARRSTVRVGASGVGVGAPGVGVAPGLGLNALVSFNRDAGRRAEALKYARELQGVLPNEAAVERLVRELERP